MNVPLIDLKAQYLAVKDELEKTVLRVMDSQKFISGQGPDVADLEKSIASYCGVRRGCALASGSEALLMMLIASGIGNGDEVITTPFTFFATAGSIARAGARPVFCDIDPRTCNIDPSKVEALITPRTRAIMPVHIYGQCAEMDAINEIALRRGLVVFEDAAQAVGSRYRGRPACSLAKAGILSFYPTKNLSGIGEGGMLLTDDDKLAAHADVLRDHGRTGAYLHAEIGWNCRLSAIQAAALHARLPHLDGWNEKRRRHATYYDNAFAPYPITTPYAEPHNHHIYHLYVIAVDDRDALQQHLRAKGVGCGVYYPLPLHLQPCFSYLGYKQGDMPTAERASRRVLALPVYPELTEEQREYVAQSVIEFFKR